MHMAPCSLAEGQLQEELPMGQRDTAQLTVKPLNSSLSRAHLHWLGLLPNPERNSTSELAPGVLAGPSPPSESLAVLPSPPLPGLPLALSFPSVLPSPTFLSMSALIR